MSVFEDRLSRRAFVAGAAGLGAAAAAGPALAAVGRRAQAGPPLASPGAFRQSVASGQAATDAITLWTRVEDLDRTSKLQVEIARDPEFANVIWRKDVLAEAERDFTVHHRAAPKGLAPGEQFFYRFYTCEQSSPVGRFRTALPPDSRAPVRIGFFSCQNFAAGFYTAHAGLVQEKDLDLVICLGDYIYEQTNEKALPERQDTTGANKDSDVQMLGEYRDKYRLYHSDPNLLAVRQNFPMLVIWDDHETENDGGAQESPNPGQRNIPTGRRLPFLERREQGYQAYFEHMPRIRNIEERNRIYGSVPLGANAELLLLDERQYRDPQPCGGSVPAPPTCSAAEKNAPGRKFLGTDQKEWLKRGLKDSRATWKIVGNGLMIMALDVPARNAVNPDQWDGYGAERKELLDFIAANNIKDVTFITGDIHTFFAGDVTPTGREGNPVTDGVAVATEFVGGSISSKGLADDTERAGLGPEAATDGAIRANNPHITYANLVRKGYGVLEARPNELLVTFRGPATTQAKTSPVSTLATFRVAKGEARVQRTDVPTSAPA